MKLGASLLVLAIGVAAQPAHAELLAGVAGADVTPEVGVPLAGYGARIRKQGPDLNPFDHHTLFEPSTGVRDPIEAQCLVLERGGQVIALLTVDAIGVEQGLVEEVVSRVRAAGVPLDAERLIVSASHTHSGPGALSRRALWQLAACDRLSRRFLRSFSRSLARVVVAAYRARRPAALGDAVAEVRGITKNRRADRSELVDEGDVDPRLRLLRLDDAATGEALAVVMNYAIHPTCLGASNLHFSADVAGAVRREAARRLGCRVLFTNGCEGDIAPRPGGERGIELIGARLGQAVAELASEIECRPDLGFTISSVRRELGPLQLHPAIGEGEVPDQGLPGVALDLVKRLNPRLREPFVSTSFRYTALRLGELVLLFVPGEPIKAVGEQLEALAHAAGFSQCWVVGLSNGHMGYIATPEEYRQGGYEAWMTFYGEDTAAKLKAALGDALARVAPY